MTSYLEISILIIIAKKRFLCWNCYVNYVQLVNKLTLVSSRSVVVIVYVKRSIRNKIEANVVSVYYSDHEAGIKTNVTFWQVAPLKFWHIVHQFSFNQLSQYNRPYSCNWIAEKKSNIKKSLNSKACLKDNWDGDSATDPRDERSVLQFHENKVCSWYITSRYI